MIDTINLGPLEAGRHRFDWDATAYNFNGDPSYKVTATLGGQPIANTALSRATVTSVSSESGVMKIQLQGRADVAYANVKAIL